MAINRDIRRRHLASILIEHYRRWERHPGVPLLRLEDIKRRLLDRTNSAYGLNERTLRRDFDYLRSVYGVKVEYDKGERGWALTSDPGEKLSDLRFKESDVIPLLVARDALEVVAGRPLEEKLRKIIDSICIDIGLNLRRENETFGLEDAVRFKAVGAAEAPSPHFDTLLQSVLGREAVEAVYRSRDRNQVPQPRVLHPHLLHCYRDQWRVVAWEPAKERMATYLLSGFQDAKLLGETFERQRNFSAGSYFDGAFGVFAGNEDHQVEIHFSREGAERVRGRKWHKTQTTTDLEDGGMIFRARVNSLVEVTSWILGFGPEAWAVQPPQLVQRVRAGLDKAISRYGKDG